MIVVKLSTKKCDCRYEDNDYDCDCRCDTTRRMVKNEDITVDIDIVPKTTSLFSFDDRFTEYYTKLL